VFSESQKQQHHRFLHLIDGFLLPCAGLRLVTTLRCWAQAKPEQEGLLRGLLRHLIIHDSVWV